MQISLAMNREQKKIS